MFIQVFCGNLIMPHQCVRCNTFYEDGSSALLSGCNRCGGKFFFYVKKESLKEAEVFTQKLTKEDKEQIESDVKEILGAESEKHPIVLNLETIKILEPGKFELDLADLFSKKPLVIKLEEGKYYIDVPSTFNAKDLSMKKTGEIKNIFDETGKPDQEENKEV